MTIRFSCPNGHSQEAVFDESRIGSTIAASFLKKYADQLAGLLDGTSDLYVVKPTPRRCQIEGCGQVVKATVVS